jgi:hypothetical protein
MAEAIEKAEQLRKDYQTVFNSEAGQRVLEDLRKTCFYYDTTLNELPHVMAHSEGLRNVVLHIETKLKLTPDKLKELQSERGQS